MIFEQADTNDIHALVNLRIAYVEEDRKDLTEDIKDQLLRVLPAYFEKHLNSDLFVYVAREDAVLSCAFLVVTEKPANPSFITGRTGTVYNVYTVPAYRRRGLAKHIMQMLLADAEKMELDYVDLNATENGYYLYEALGFKETKPKHVPMKYTFTKK